MRRARKGARNESYSKHVALDVVKRHKMNEFTTVTITTMIWMIGMKIPMTNQKERREENICCWG